MPQSSLYKHKQYPALILSPCSPSLRCPSTQGRAWNVASAASPGRRKRPTETLPRVTSQSTRFWGRRACSGHGGWAGRAPNRRAGQSASRSRDSTCTDALSDRSCLSWWRIAWSTWACPPWDTVSRAANDVYKSDRQSMFLLCYVSWVTDYDL